MQGTKSFWNQISTKILTHHAFRTTNKASVSSRLFDLLEAGEEGERKEVENRQKSAKLVTNWQHSAIVAKIHTFQTHWTACGGITAACTKTDGQPMKSEIFTEHSSLVLQSSKCCRINKGVDDRASVRSRKGVWQPFHTSDIPVWSGSFEIPTRFFFFFAAVEISSRESSSSIKTPCSTPASQNMPCFPFIETHCHYEISTRHFGNANCPNIYRLQATEEEKELGIKRSIKSTQVNKVPRT